MLFGTLVGALVIVGLVSALARRLLPKTTAGIVGAGVGTFLLAATVSFFTTNAADDADGTERWMVMAACYFVAAVVWTALAFFQRSGGTPA